MNKLLTAVVAVAVLVGSGAFYGGMKYAQNQTPQMARQSGIANTGTAGQSGLRGARSGMRSGFSSGEIIAKDERSITVKLQDGGSKIVFLSGATRIGKSVDGAVADLANGVQVLVNGDTNSDGSINATTIQIRPNMPSPNPAK